MNSRRFVPVIASAAKQSVGLRRGGGMDCFVAALLAMTRTGVVTPYFILL
jgi:hypothetical protein